jgi:macrolide transport system ATP-binding/permease protein
MRHLRALMARVAGLFSRRRVNEFDEELQALLDLQIDDGVKAGHSVAEARRRALIKMGGLESARQRYREQASIPWLEHVIQDIRFTLRQLTKSPVYSVTAVATLSLGLAAALAIFAFVNAALVRPLPYAEPGRLVTATGRTAEIPHAALSWPDYLDWKQSNSVFSAFEAHKGGGVALTTAAGIELVPVGRVTDGFFRALGAAPALGRDFRDGESRPGAARVALISHAAWLARFGGASDIVGRAVTLSGEPTVIVGVLPASFHFAPRGRPDFWLPFQATSGCDLRRSCHSMRGIARLKPGVTVDQAQAELSTIASALEREYPNENRGQGASVRALALDIVGELRPALLALLAGAALLLAIACVNVVSLLVVRAEGRRRELSVRSTLGASGGRLLAQFATEAVVLAGLSTGFALLLSSAAVQLLMSLLSEDMIDRLPMLAAVSIDATVGAVACGIGLVATIVLAIAPMARLRSRELLEGLSEGSRGSSGLVWKRLGGRLVVLELATATVLLVGAGLLGQSLHRLLRVELGFQPDRLVTVRVAALGSRFEQRDASIQLGRDVVHAISTLPGVEMAAITSVPPVSFNGNTDWIRIVGRPWNGTHIEVLMRETSAGYFGMLRTRLLHGRFFTANDSSDRPRVAIINQTMASRYFAGQNPVGQRFGDRELSPQSIKEIVGVVDDVREGPLDEEVWPAVYYPFEQHPSDSFFAMARTAGDEHALLPAMASAIRVIGPDVGTRSPAVMRDRIAESPVAALRSSSAWLAGGFAALALVLSVIGLYGVVAYSVGQRTREIGLRMAMGAVRGTVYRLILGDAARLVAVGIVFGTLAAIAAARLFGTLLFGTAPWDAPTLLGVAVVMALAAAAASFLPARRAASLNPVEALRIE